MKKVVINKCFGGFGLSHKAIMKYAKLKGFKLYAYESNYVNGKIVLTKIDDNYKDKDCSFLEHYKKPIDDPSFNDADYFSYLDIERDDPDLVKVIETLGEEANGEFSKLKIIEIPDGIDYYINNYDGVERVEEVHRSWG